MTVCRGLNQIGFWQFLQELDVPLPKMSIKCKIAHFLSLSRRHFSDRGQLGLWSPDFPLGFSMENPDSRVRAGQGPRNASWVTVRHILKPTLHLQYTLVIQNMYEIVNVGRNVWPINKCKSNPCSSDIGPYVSQSQSSLHNNMDFPTFYLTKEHIPPRNAPLFLGICCRNEDHLLINSNGAFQQKIWNICISGQCEMFYCFVE